MIVLADRVKHLERLRDLQGHYSDCGIYIQGLFTISKRKDDPTRKCTCGWAAAIVYVRDYVNNYLPAAAGLPPYDEVVP